ncbi:hypothetical protein [Calditerricola satsumensis]|uniref:hypothetical protein n=1 Tax=Calditerricola satsumensis TaxID=373054 RepID=UPI00210A9C5F|nr:hypothetical protein [Calditerricola satsumensis]
MSGIFDLDDFAWCWCCLSSSSSLALLTDTNGAFGSKREQAGNRRPFHLTGMARFSGFPVNLDSCPRTPSVHLRICCGTTPAREGKRS